MRRDEFSLVDKLREEAYQKGIKDERKRIIETLQDYAFVNMDETFSLKNMKVMLKTVIEIVNERGAE